MSAFVSLAGVPIRITSSTVGLKICTITATIKKSIIEKKKKKHNKVALLANAKLNSIDVLISRVLTGSRVSHDEFVLVNYALEQYDDMKEEAKKIKTSRIY